MLVRKCTSMVRVARRWGVECGVGRYGRGVSRSHGVRPPAEYMSAGTWPDGQLAADAPPAAAVAQHVARALRAAMVETGIGQRPLALASGVAHTTIGRILAGTVLCDIGTLAHLEHTLGRPLWPRTSSRRRPRTAKEVDRAAVPKTVDS